ncbi:MAG: histidine ammonia-lyase [Longimicrobiales bacterium]
MAPTSDTADVLLDGRSLTLEAVERLALDPGIVVGVAPSARDAIREARDVVEARVRSGERVYGVTTGFGRLADVVIPPEQRRELQRNLIRSHAAGVGEPLDRAAVRACMVLRANALARGNSGCRLEVVERLVTLLNEGIHPRVPRYGSVGASGDLAPLAHIALAVLGEGPAECGGREDDVGVFLGEHGLEGLTLEAKEGLALINGTQVTTGLGILALLAAERAVDTAEVAGAMSLEALLGTPEAFRAEIQEARPHPGQAESARRLRGLLEESQIRESHRNDDPRVQDAYALRCMPQVHGAARDALRYVRGVLETEANSATDNPLVFAGSGLVVSGGNFHAQVVSAALDFLAIAMADLASISERRIERLLNPDLSMGLPAFLTDSPGLRSGFMIAQVSAVDCLAEMRVLAHPASVDSVTTSANQEDHVSMGLAAARKARQSVALAERVLAAELLCAAEGLEYRRPLRSSPWVEAAFGVVREDVPRLQDDRVLAPDLEAVAHGVRSDRFAALARGAVAGGPVPPSSPPETLL